MDRINAEQSSIGRLEVLIHWVKQSRERYISNQRDFYPCRKSAHSLLRPNLSECIIDPGILFKADDFHPCLYDDERIGNEGLNSSGKSAR